MGAPRVLVTGLSKAGLESAQKEIGKNAIVVPSDPSPEQPQPQRGASSPCHPHAAGAADDHHFLTFVTFHVYSPRENRVALLF